MSGLAATHFLPSTWRCVPPLGPGMRQGQPHPKQSKWHQHVVNRFIRALACTSTVAASVLPEQRALSGSALLPVRRRPAQQMGSSVSLEARQVG